MKVVYKYKVSSLVEQAIEMPMGAEILSARFQFDALFIWVLVETEHPVGKRVITVLAAGQKTSASFDHTFVNTCTTMSQGMYLVFHVFDGGYVNNKKP